MRGPLVAFEGTFTSMRESLQRRTSAGTPLNSTSLTPNCISLSFCPTVGPKFRPSIWTISPAGAVKLLWAFVQVLGQRLRKTTSDLSDALHGDKHGEKTEKDNLSQD